MVTAESFERIFSKKSVVLLRAPPLCGKTVFGHLLAHFLQSRDKVVYYIPLTEAGFSDLKRYFDDILIDTLERSFSRSSHRFGFLMKPKLFMNATCSTPIQFVSGNGTVLSVERILLSSSRYATSLQPFSFYALKIVCSLILLRIHRIRIQISFLRVLLLDWV